MKVGNRCRNSIEFVELGVRLGETRHRVRSRIDPARDVAEICMHLRLVGIGEGMKHRPLWLGVHEEIALCEQLAKRLQDALAG
jgi:hypothetical protein